MLQVSRLKKTYLNKTRKADEVEDEYVQLISCRGMD